MNKFVTFLLGMLFGIIFVFGALFGVGFYFYKNGNISMFTEEIEGLGKFNTMTVEEIINLVISMAEDSQTKGSLGYLKANYNLDISALLDPEGLKEGLFDYFNDLNIGYLMSGDVMGFLGTIKLGIGFAFAEGMVSQGGVSLLREKSLGDILGGEGNILSNLVEVFGGVRLGAFLGENYSETPNDDGAYEYEYIGEGEGGLFALLANCELSAVLKIISGQSDIFEEIKIGGLSELGELAFSDLLSSTDFGELLEGKTLGDLIEEEEGEYTLQFMSLFNGIYIGKLLGYTKTGDDWTKGEGEAVTGIELALARIDVGALLDDFSIDSVIDGLFLGDLMGYAKGALTTDSCPEGCIDHEEGEHIVKYVWTNDGNALSGIEAQLANFDLSDLLNDFSVDALLGDMLLGDIMGYEKDEQGAWTDKNGNLITGVEKALADCLMSDILEGFDIDNILGDVYLGDIMGFKQGELTAESCLEGCTDHEESEHIVKYQWTKPVDGIDEEVKGIELALANTLMSDILEGFDVKNILGDVQLGDIMGYEKDEQGAWTDENGNLITGVEKALADCLMSEILEGFNVNSILGEMYLGEVMGFKQGELTADSCGEECVTEHEHIVKYQWTKPVDGIDEEVKGIELALANTFMSDILEGFDVSNVLGDVQLGDIMGYEKDENGAWTDENGNLITGVEKALADCLMSEILEGFNVNGILGELYLGEVMGFKQGELTAESCGEECVTEHEHIVKYQWTKPVDGKPDEEVKGIELALANTFMSDILEGFDVKNILGDVYLGEVMGYYLEGGVWYNNDTESKVPLTGIEKALADCPMIEILEGFNVSSILGEVYLGEVMGFKQGELTADSCGEECVTEHEHIVKYNWTKPIDGKPDEEVKGIELALANTFMSDILEGFDVKNILGDVFLGEVMGYTRIYTCGHEEEEHIHTDECSYIWEDSSGNEMKALELALADTLMSDILNGDFEFEGLIEEIYLGEIMGYTRDDEPIDGTKCPPDCDNDEEGHEHDYYKYKWYKDEGKEEVKGIEQALANTLMNSLLGGKLNINSIIGHLSLGEVMGYYLEDGVWYNKNAADKVSLTGIEKALAETEMNDILGGNFNVKSILGDVQLGEVMGYYLEGGVWYNNDTESKVPLTGIEKALADCPMDNILEGFNVKSILGDVYLGEVMGFKQGTLTTDSCLEGCTDHEESEHIVKYNWTKPVDGKPDEEVKGIELALANTFMRDILEGFDVKNILGDVYLGEVMGYYLEGGVWYNNDTESKVPLTGIEKALADCPMDNILEGFNVKSILGDVYLGEVMGFKQGTLTTDSCLEGCTDHEESEHIVKYNWTKPVDGKPDEEVKGIELALANTFMRDILEGFDVKNILGDVYLGEVMGYYLEGGVWYNNDTESKVPLTGIEKALADCPMENILEGFNVKSILGDVYLGEVMGYTRVYTCGHEEEEEHIHTDECSYIWKDPSNNEIKGIEKALANTLMSNILQGFDVKNILGDVYLGEVMGYSQDEGVWVDAGGVALKGIEKALAGTLMSDILEGFNVNDILGELYLGEVMGYSQDEHGVWVDAGGVPLKGIEKALAASQMSEILNGIDIIDILDGMFLGEVMGFTQGVLTGDSCGEECVTEHEHIVKYQWTKSVGGIDEEVKGIEFALANTLMSDVLGGDFNISKILGDMMLGEVMGYEKTLEGWKKGGADIKGIELRLADVEMSKLLDEGLDINDLLGDMYLGEVMNYNLVFLDAEGEGHTHSMESCPYVWQKEGADIKGIEGRLANVQMLTLLNGELDMDEVIGSMYIGELMGYTQGVLTGGTCDPDCHSEEIGHIHDYKEYEWWKDEAKTTPVEDKVTLILCNMVMTQILNGDVDLKDKVLALTLKDLLDVEGNTILELLADTPINDLGNSLNDLYIGELMGLTLAYTCATVHDHDIDLCDHLWLMEIEDISSYSDVAGEEGFVMSKGGDYIKIYEGLWYEAKLEGGIYIYKDVDSITKAMADTLVGGVGNISSRLTSAVSKASIGELIEMGVLNLSDNYDTLDYLFCQTHYDTEWEKSLAHSGGTCETLVDGSDRAAWWNLALPDFLNELISKMAP